MKVLALTAFAVLTLTGFANATSSPDIIPIVGGVSGTATTTRYWDCCKPTCAWAGNTASGTAMHSCSADGKTVIDDNTQSGCVGGAAYMCSNQHCRAVNSTLAYGFVAAAFLNAKSNMCCSCVLLEFQGALTGKFLLAQVSNTGSDNTPGLNQFDIQIPGGGVGYYDKGCPTQWGTSTDVWGQQYGGIDTEAQCYKLPADLQEGCLFRFKFMQGESNPNVNFYQVQCPADLIAISGCPEPTSY